MFRRIRAHALSDVDVRFVSLVRRGANRIPFRFTKKDASPVDFFKFFHKSETPPPSEGKAGPGPGSVTPASPEGSAEPDPNDTVAAKLDALVKSLDELSGLVQSRLDAIDTRFEAVEATVRKTEASMRGAVIGIAYGDPPAAPTRSGKPGRLPPLLDTGMSGFGSPG